MPQSHLCSFTVLPSITEMSGNQTVTEGGNVTLKCLAYGKPTPNVTWTRLSDNRIVSMPLTDITRQEAGKYKCIANNGIGSPAIGDLWIVVQCELNAISVRVQLEFRHVFPGHTFTTAHTSVILMLHLFS